MQLDRHGCGFLKLVIRDVSLPQLDMICIHENASILRVINATAPLYESWPTERLADRQGRSVNKHTLVDANHMLACAVP